MNPLTIIDVLRNSDRYIESIYTMGGCYQFHLVLRTLYPQAMPYLSKEEDHVVSKIDNVFYDITGIVGGEEYTPLREVELPLVRTWSFGRKMALSIGECPCCEEPILV
jgi:hypothetical protein